MLRFLTAGESHGQCLSVIIEGLPARIPIHREAIDEQMRRRQGGYGRGGRMKIEQDSVEILSGVRHGYTLGSPIMLRVENRDWVNWKEQMATDPVKTPPEPVTRLRPGHADLAGALKYGHTDLRNVIERASSRETAARVAAGSLCRQFLSAFGVTIHSHVISIAEVGYPAGSEPDLQLLDEADFASFWEQVESSEMRCASADVTARMKERIQIGKRSGDTCGGVFEVVAAGVPPGLGSYSQWDRRLSARIGEALLSIPSAKGIEIGSGFAAARLAGSQVHDIVRHDATRGWYHVSNHAGGIEGGISNGEPIVARVAVKPIPTLAHPLPSADLATGDNLAAARYERSDVCVVPAAGVVGEAMLALTLTDAWLEKFGGDNLDEIRSSYLAFRSTLGR